MKVAIPKQQCYIMSMSRIKKVAHILNLVLIGARLARAFLQAYKLRTCIDLPSIRHFRVPRQKKGTGSPR